MEYPGVSVAVAPQKMAIENKSLKKQRKQLFEEIETSIEGVYLKLEPDASLSPKNHFILCSLCLPDFFSA